MYPRYASVTAGCLSRNPPYTLLDKTQNSREYALRTYCSFTLVKHTTEITKNVRQQELTM